MKKLKLLFILSLILLTGCGSNQDQQTIADLQSTVDSLTKQVSDLQSQADQYSGVKSDLETANNSIKELETQLESLKAENESMSLKLEALYTIEPMDSIMYAISEADTYGDLFGEVLGYEKVGGLTVNQEVHITGQSKSTKWYEIEINGEKQYVSNQFLADTKIQVTAPTGNSDNSGNTGNTGSSETGTDSSGTLPGGNADVEGATDAASFFQNAPSIDMSGWDQGDFSGLEGIEAY